MVEIAHQGGTGLAAGHMPRRTAHVDVDDVGAGRFRDPRAFGHPVALAAGELHDMGANAGCLTTKPGHRLAVYEVIAGGHLGYNEPGAKARGQTPERGVGDAGHRREENPVGELNVAYFQRLRALAIQAGHGSLVSLAAAPLRHPMHILSTNLVQSSFMPTL